MAVRTVVVLLVLAGTIAAAWAGSGRWLGGPQRSALVAFCAEVPPEQAGYPQRGAAIRARAWLTAAPGQPDGVDLFFDLHDATLSRERLITPADLRETVRHILGLAWDSTAAAWTGGGRTVPLAEVRSLLVAALPTATDADAVIDLLTGSPGPGVPELRPLLVADPPRLDALRIVSFSGLRGRLLLDRSKGSYVQVERGYHGLLLSIDALGLDPAWRVLRLRGVAP